MRKPIKRSTENPEREQLKAQLTLRIYRLIEGRGLTQPAAGKILGIQLPHVSVLMRGQSGGEAEVAEHIAAPPLHRDFFLFLHLHRAPGKPFECFDGGVLLAALRHIQRLSYIPLHRPRKGLEILS